MSPRVFLIVLCYNGINLTLDCLESLLSQNYTACEILVVDNASQDGTAETVRMAYPQIEVIATGENLGYVGGNNIGMQFALGRGADMVFLINNDTLLDRSCVSALVEALAANPHIGIIGPMVYTYQDECMISSAGGKIDWRHADAINVGAGEIDRGQHPARNTDFINGCGLLATRPAIERAGMLDPRYFMYWEETDWCRRVNRAGFGVRFEPAGRMTHRAGLGVSDLKPSTLYYVTRNRLRFFAIHTPRAQMPVTLVHALYGALRGIILHQQARRPAHARATELALWHALTGRWGRYDVAQWPSGPAARPAKAKSRASIGG